MKGQTRLDRCMEAEGVKIGTRFLYRDHGLATGALYEGTLKEVITDADDEGQKYVRLDDSGEWMAPGQLFIEFIFPVEAKEERAAAKHHSEPSIPVPKRQHKPQPHKK